MITLIILTELAVFIKSLHILYLFQIKEYRNDRFFVYAREVGLYKLLYNFHIHYPARTGRNALIIFGIFVFLTLFFLLALEQNIIYYILTFGLFLSPIIAFCIVYFGVFMTAYPAYLRRQLLIINAHNKLRKSKAQFIGVTGSYGKTSVKEFIYTLLSISFEVEKTEKNQNTDVGIALSFLKYLKKTTSFFVIEFGAYREGEIQRACRGIPLTQAILTGLGNQHLALYGSRHALIREETYLLTKIPKNGRIYTPVDAQVPREIIKKILCPMVTYGLSQNADISASIKTSDFHKQTARIRYKDHDFNISTHLLGAHSVVNLLPAIGIAIDYGISTQKIIKKISTIRPSEGKLSIHKGISKSIIVNDSMNSNVEGFIAAIDLLQKAPGKRKIITSQGIIELGVEKRGSYQKIIDEVIKKDCFLYTTDFVFGELINDKRIIIFNDVVTMFRKIVKSLESETTIVVEGVFPPDLLKSLIK